MIKTISYKFFVIAIVISSLIILANYLKQKPLFFSMSNDSIKEVSVEKFAQEGYAQEKINYEAFSGANTVDLNKEFTKPVKTFYIEGEVTKGIKMVVEFEDGSRSELIKVLATDDHYGDSEADEKLLTLSQLYTFEKSVRNVELFFDIDGIKAEIKSPEELIQVEEIKTQKVKIDTQQVTPEYKSMFFTQLGLSIIPRETWGAPTTSVWTPKIAKVNRIVIHHTATSVNMSDPKSSVKAIYDFHRLRCNNNNGSYPNCPLDETWGDIGYNYLIDPYGNIYEGRAGGNGAVGAHAIPNSGSIGISMMGTYSNSLPTSQALESLRRLTAYLSRYNDMPITWQNSLYGHRDFMSTACPGQYFYDRIAQIGSESYAYYNANSSINNSINHSNIAAKNREYVLDGGNVALYARTSGLSSEKKAILLANKRGAVGVTEVGDRLVYMVPKDLVYSFINEMTLIAPETKIQPEYIYKKMGFWSSATPNDYDPTIHWNLDKINAVGGWDNLGGCTSDDSCGGSEDVKIAVIDTGVAHSDTNYDPGDDDSYTTTRFGFYYIEYPTDDTQDGVYTNATSYKGYERDFDVAPELSDVNFVTPYDAVQDLFCELRTTADGDASNDCNAVETARINQAYDYDGHGTIVTSIIAGRSGDEDTGGSPNKIVGLAHNVSIMPINVFFPNDTSMCQTSSGASDLTCANPLYDFRSVSTTDLIIDGIDHAIANGADVINMSLGGGGYDPNLQDKIQEAVDADIIVVAASGNSGSDTANFMPGNMNGVITVGATDSLNARAVYSNFGDELDFVAPVGDGSSGDNNADDNKRIAVHTYSCSNCSNELTQNLFTSFTSVSSPPIGTGTSFAAPQVSALAGLMKSKKPSLTTDEFILISRLTAQDVGTSSWDSQTGWGIINAGNALDLMDPPTITVTEPSTNVNVGFTYNSIAWTATGYDLNIDFYYDTDNTGFDGDALTMCQRLNDANGSCDVDTQFIPNGTYYIYGCAEDLISQTTCDYADGTLIINHSTQTDSGKVNLDTNQITVNFNTSFNIPPKVFTTITSESGSDTIFAQVSNVTTTGFNLVLKEDTKLGYDNIHFPEEVSWVAFEAATSSIQLGEIDLDTSPMIISFPNTFGASPVVFAEKQTINGLDIAYADISGVTNEEFVLKLEESVGNDQTHTYEAVAWVAIDPATSGIGTATSDHNWSTVNLTGYSETPIIIAQEVTEVGTQNSQIDIKETSKDKFEFRIEEDPRGLDGIHAVETINYYVLPFTHDKSQSGTASINSNQINIRFPKGFDKVPVLKVDIQSEVGGDTAEADILKLTETGFTVRIEEDIKAGWDGIHSANETIYWRAEITRDENGFEVGKSTVNNNWTTVTFDTSQVFNATPLVFAEINTENGADTAEVDIRNITTTGFEIRVEEDVKVGWDGGHTNETIGWIAVDPTQATSLETLNVFVDAVATDPDPWTYVDFSDSGLTVTTTPKLLFEVNSEVGADTINIDVKDITLNGFYVRIEEERINYDKNHATEKLVFWVIE